jgi:hypothetical protein
MASGHSELYGAAKGEVPSKWFLGGTSFGMNKLKIATSETGIEPDATQMEAQVLTSLQQRSVVRIWITLAHYVFWNRKYSRNLIAGYLLCRHFLQFA